MCQTCPSVPGYCFFLMGKCLVPPRYLVECPQALAAVKKHARRPFPQGRRNMGLAHFHVVQTPLRSNKATDLSLFILFFLFFFFLLGSEAACQIPACVPPAGPHDGCTLPRATNYSRAVLPSGLQHLCANNIVVYPQVEKNFPSNFFVTASIPNCPAARASSLRCQCSCAQV